ncbi:MAG TPA: SAM-dependent methyltransferase [Planctomycetaceae bacterium]|nr:SAM-dependent methyltransferase [Planctomycetaceae bacterium]HRF00690.1 cyclopropane-fatty-acyl-phospholipid synthase family protein [Pirellulaceae bacterium]
MNERWEERVLGWIEAGWVPEAMLRRMIRALCRRRIRRLASGGCEAACDDAEALMRSSLEGPVAPVPHKANEQHYEVPASVFDRMLGTRRKYSCCYWDASTRDLDAAETRSLELTCEHAGVRDGDEVLELGCGWGALSTFIAERYPNCRITGVSNSASQREYIEARARRAGFGDRIRILTADMNRFDIDHRFDRIVSIEMFEHMRNYRALLRRCRGWLKDDGALLVHVFCHRHFTYPFDEEGAANWMGRHFFSGGLMPGDDWLLRFQEDLVVTRQWRWSGDHYRRTAEAWLGQMAIHRNELLTIFREVYPNQSPELWYRRWRMLYLAGAEMFGADRGEEWWVSHYRFEPRGAERLDERLHLSRAERPMGEGRGELVAAGEPSLE